MSATDAVAERSKRERLAAYLRRRVGDGEFYFKSRYVAEDVGLSPKEIGALMPELAEEAEAIDVSRWSYSNATTWRVRPAGTSPDTEDHDGDANDHEGDPKDDTRDGAGSDLTA